MGSFSELAMGAGLVFGSSRLDYAYRSVGDLVHSQNLAWTRKRNPRAPQGGKEVPGPAAPPARERLPVPPVGARPETEKQRAQSDSASELKRARSLFDEGRLEQALRETQGLLQSQPDNPEAWLLSGHCYEEIGEKTLALDAYRRSLELKPDPELRAWVGELERIEAEKEASP